ncbi:MAG: hypothetical protein ABWZ02_13370 [Nakamurella sp.]
MDLEPAYDVEPWHDFMVASVGAAAALTGLLFVALSINVDEIIHLVRLPGRAATTLGMLLTLMASGMVVLAPAQGDLLLGIELAILGCAIGAFAARSMRPRRQPGDAFQVTVLPLILMLVPSVALIIGGVSLAAGVGGGLYWTLIGFVLGVGATVTNAWVLLVEIKR